MQDNVTDATTTKVFRPLLVRLLYDAEPALDPRHLAKLVENVDAEIQLVTNEDEEVDLTNHVLDHAQPIAVTVLPSGPIRHSELTDDLNHTFGWLEADDAAKNVRYGMLLAEIGPSSSPPKDRAEAMSAIVTAAVQISDPLATQWLTSGQLVAPDDVMADAWAGPINVRMFAGDEADDEWLMDTVGLLAFGLLDLQCHFRQLDPGLVAGWLRQTASRFATHGPLPDEGSTIDGPSGRPWICRYEPALVAPTRLLIDLDPGPPYSAGKRL